MRAMRLHAIPLSPRDPGLGPQASWDFHALPRDDDHIIFVARTAPDGRVIEGVTES
ncbi:hypothetical protein SAMN05444002_0581 [Vannielia litorea]|uniref:Uncharacterized protein n=2 Tax=Vannielia litorea TaxID=1217970 RepID=A0A1N6EC63_9RHOB|nr:hypothetical protein SAMN05444002_0581 [Vannielia litorea]